MKSKGIFTRILSAILCAIMIVGMVPVAIAAEGEALALEVGTVELTLDDSAVVDGFYTVNVPINVTANTGFNALQFTVTYNEALELIGWTNGTVMPDGALEFTPSVENATSLSPFTVTYVNLTNDENSTATGKLIELQFKVAATVAAGTNLPVSVEVTEAYVQGDARDAALITTAVVPGGITTVGTSSDTNAPLVLIEAKDIAGVKINKYAGAYDEATGLFTATVGEAINHTSNDGAYVNINFGKIAIGDPAIKYVKIGYEYDNAELGAQTGDNVNVFMSIGNTTGRFWGLNTSQFQYESGDWMFSLDCTGKGGDVFKSSSYAGAVATDTYNAIQFVPWKIGTTVPAGTTFSVKYIAFFEDAAAASAWIYGAEEIKELSKVNGKDLAITWGSYYTGAPGHYITADGDAITAGATAGWSNSNTKEAALTIKNLTVPAGTDTIILNIKTTSGAAKTTSGNVIINGTPLNADFRLSALGVAPIAVDISSLGNIDTITTMELKPFGLNVSNTDVRIDSIIFSGETPKFSVTFMADGVQFGDAVELEMGSALVYPEVDPIKDGYEFKGWDVAEGTIINTDTVVNAIFKKIRAEGDPLVLIEAKDIAGVKINKYAGAYDEATGLFTATVGEAINHTSNDSAYVNINFGKIAIGDPAIKYVKIGYEYDNAELGAQTGDNVNVFMSIGNTTGRFWGLNTSQFRYESGDWMFNLNCTGKGGDVFNSSSYAGAAATDTYNAIQFVPWKIGTTVPAGTTFSVKYIAFFEDAAAASAWIYGAEEIKEISRVNGSELHQNSQIAWGPYYTSTATISVDGNAVTATSSAGWGNADGNECAITFKNISVPAGTDTIILNIKTYSWYTKTTSANVIINGTTLDADFRLSAEGVAPIAIDISTLGGIEKIDSMKIIPYMGTTQNGSVKIDSIIFSGETSNVTFKVDGEVYEEKVVGKGSALVYPETNPVRDGYEFKGWSVPAGTVINEDTVVNAVFTETLSTIYGKNLNVVWGDMYKQASFSPEIGIDGNAVYSKTFNNGWWATGYDVSKIVLIKDIAVPAGATELVLNIKATSSVPNSKPDDPTHTTAPNVKLDDVGIYVDLTPAKTEVAPISIDISELNADTIATMSIMPFYDNWQWTSFENTDIRIESIEFKGEVTELPETVEITVSATEGGSVDKTSGAYAVGSTVTFTATPDEDYIFNGWYLNGINEVVSTSLSYTLTVESATSIEARFIKDINKTNVKLNVENGRDVTLGSFEVTGNIVGDNYVASGEAVEITATATEAGVFGYWQRTVSTSGISVYLGINESLDAYALGTGVFYQPVFYPAGTTGKVIYVDATNLILSDNGEPKATKPGYTCTGWKVREANKVVTVKEPVYVIDDTTTSTLTVYNANGVPSSLAPSFNEVVTVDAGANNVVWTLTVGDETYPVSYNREYSFRYRITAATATLTATAANETPKALVSGIEAVHADAATRFIGSYYVPESYTVTGYGMLLTSDAAVADSMILDTDGVIVGNLATAVNEDSMMFVVNKNKTLDGETRTTWYARAFLIYTDGTANHVIYGETISK